MRAREMHPLCCLAADYCPGGAEPDAPPAAADGAAAVAGVLSKWTNIGRGWRPRWFAIRGGVLAYWKIPRRVAAEEATSPPPTEAAAGVRLIGGAARGAGEQQPIGFVHLKVSSLPTSVSRLLLLVYSYNLIANMVPLRATHFMILSPRAMS